MPIYLGYIGSFPERQLIDSRGKAVCCPGCGFLPDCDDLTAFLAKAQRILSQRLQVCSAVDTCYMLTINLPEKKMPVVPHLIE